MEAWDAARGRGSGDTQNPGEGPAGADARVAQDAVAAAAALAAAGTEAEQARRCAWDSNLTPGILIRKPPSKDPSSYPHGL